MRKKHYTQLPSTVAVGSFEDLTDCVESIRDGKLSSSLLIVGPPGVGKTETVLRTLGKAAYPISGRATAYQLYKELYDAREVRLIVLDDVDTLSTDKHAIGLLKQLCETSGTRRLSWRTSMSVGEEIPTEFEIKCRLIVLANDWRSDSADGMAVLNRLHCLHFNPSNDAIHEKARTFVPDPELLEYVEAHLHLIPQHSLRLYSHALELKEAGLSGVLNWKRYIDGHFLQGKLRELALIVEDARFATERQRQEEYQRRVGVGKSQFYEDKKKLPLGKGEATPSNGKAEVKSRTDRGAKAVEVATGRVEGESSNGTGKPRKPRCRKAGAQTKRGKSSATT